MPVIRILKKDTYLAMVKNSLNSYAFKDVYGQINNKKKNITQNGDLSCAYFVSSILKLFDLTKNTHLTVDGTTSDLINSGWKKINLNKISAGDIIIWQEDKKHKHIGFYIGDNQAISNNSKSKKIKKHHYTFNNKRKIEEVLHIKI